MPSVPIQITSPGYSVRCRVIALMKVAMPNSISPVRNCVFTSPLTRTVVRAASRSKSVSIHGPIGLKVSQFLARQKVRSEACQSRSLTSLPMV